jgi:hypothetical protein
MDGADVRARNVNGLTPLERVPPVLARRIMGAVRATSSGLCLDGDPIQ